MGLRQILQSVQHLRVVSLISEELIDICKNLRIRILFEIMFLNTQFDTWIIPLLFD